MNCVFIILRFHVLVQFKQVQFVTYIYIYIYMFLYLYSSCCLLFLFFGILTAIPPGLKLLWMLLSGYQSKAMDLYGSYSNCRSPTVSICPTRTPHISSRIPTGCHGKHPFVWLKPNLLLGRIHLAKPIMFSCIHQFNHSMLLDFIVLHFSFFFDLP